MNRSAQLSKLLLTSLLGLISPQLSLQAEVPWYDRTWVGLEVGPTGAQFGGDGIQPDYGYAQDWNGREIVERTVECGGEYLVIWARDGEYAYYNSEVLPKPPGLGDRDPLKETMDAAKEHDLPIIAYCVVQYGSRALREHPEYEMKGVDGAGLNRVCFNSDYWEYLQRVIREIAGYGVAGFHVDMLDQGFGPPHGCWCDNCRELFREMFGEPMPAGADWSPAWHKMLEFRYATSDRFEKKITDFIRSLNPEMTVDFNYHGYPPFSWEVGQRPVSHAANGDFVTAEAGVWGFGALSGGMVAKFLRAALPGGRYQVAIQRGVRMYHDQTTRPIADMRWETMSLLSHGAQVTMIDKTAFDGWLDPLFYQRIGEIFEEVHTKREHWGHDPIEEVGLYYSLRSRDWYGRDAAWKYQQAFLGAAQILVESHVPYGMALSENMDLERLKDFKVLWIPNAPILSAEEIELFREYVWQGGHLIATGITGTRNEFGGYDPSPAWQDLIGANIVQELATDDNHWRFTRELKGELSQWSHEIPIRWPFLIRSPALQLTTQGARSVGELLLPHRTVLQRLGKHGTEWPMSANQKQPSGPAALIHEVGQGQVVTLAASPGFAYAGDWALSEHRQLMENILDYLIPDPAIDIDAPSYVEAVPTRDQTTGKVRIHWIPYATPGRPTPSTGRPKLQPHWMKDVPPFRATVTLKVGSEIKSVNALDARTRITQRSNRIDLEALAGHETLILEMED